MTTTHSFDENTKTIYVVSEGSVSIEELMEDEKSILENPKFKKGYNKFVDFSKALPGPTADFEKIEICAKMIEETQSLRGKCKWSIYAPHDEAHFFSKIFARLTKHLELETKVFDNEDEALQWLGLK